MAKAPIFGTRIADNHGEAKHFIASAKVTLAEDRYCVKASYVDLSGAYASPQLRRTLLS